MTAKPAEPAFEALPGRVTTGSSELDRLLLGGIPQSYAVILTSPPSDERELLIKRFLEAGTTAHATTIYFTTEPESAKALAKEFPSDFYLFVCNPHVDAIIQSLPNIFKLKGVENLTNINIALTQAFRGLNPICCKRKENMHRLTLRRSAAAPLGPDPKVAYRTPHPTEVNGIHHSGSDKPPNASARGTARHPQPVRRRNQHPRSRNRQRLNPIPQNQKNEQPEIPQRRNAPNRRINRKHLKSRLDHKRLIAAFS